MTDLVDALADLESSDDLHAARLLILLEVYGGKDGRGRLEGLTKLAKLDFFLRYPVMLERGLLARNKPTSSVQLEAYEQTCVESKMVRYRFGPWDHRYRRFLNLLIGKGLIDIRIEGRTVSMGVTAQGRVVAQELAGQSTYKDIVRRARTLKAHLDLTATNLMRFVYQTFPEISSLRMNEYIEQ